MTPETKFHGIEFYDLVRTLFAREGLVHGTRVMDLAIAAGRRADAAEAASKALTRLATDGAIQPAAIAPTHSQLAWASLGGCAAKRFESEPLAWYWRAVGELAHAAYTSVLNGLELADF